MTIKGILLTGAALCTLSLAPALASSAPHIAVAQAHAGHAQIKTAMHVGKISNLTSTIAVSTGVSTSADYKVKTELNYTYYTYFDSGSFCNSTQKTSVKLATKKTTYAKLGTSTQTLSGYCSTSPTIFYGDTYELTTKKGAGSVDTFVSTLVGKKIHFNGGVYDIYTNLDVSVYIES